MPTKQMEFNFSQQVSESCLVNTHLGKIPTSEMGITLVHEHVFNKFPYWKKEISDSFTLEQLNSLKKYGVQTIIDLTPYTPLGSYKQILENAEVNIICCTGFYLGKYIPKSYKEASTLDLVRQLSKQLQLGRGSTGIRPGILKVAGQGEVLTQVEERLFTVVGILQNEFKIPVATHSPKGANSHLHQLIKAGANPEHIFISHLDRGIGNKLGFEQRLLEIKQILDIGAYVLFCEFGNEYEQVKNKTTPIMRLFKTLLDCGYKDKMLVSGDSSWHWKNGKIHLKNAHQAGHPRTYDYVFTQIIPVLRAIGMSDEEINALLINNPKRLFEC